MIAFSCFLCIDISPGEDGIKPLFLAISKIVWEKSRRKKGGKKTRLSMSENDCIKHLNIIKRRLRTATTESQNLEIT